MLRESIYVVIHNAIDLTHHLIKAVLEQRIRQSRGKCKLWDITRVSAALFTSNAFKILHSVCIKTSNSYLGHLPTSTMCYGSYR